MESKKIVVYDVLNNSKAYGILHIDEFDDIKETISLFVDINGKKITAESDNCFNAMVKIRRQLETVHQQLMCKGARRDVYPSPMQMRMGECREAYMLSMGKPARLNQIVNIFDVENEISICTTVDEQERYYAEWVQSLV
ncbi:MAG: hypothetical protein IJN43_17300 [Ruminococcus sp.]|nr:hypothetical protein [Ruminococcus sp.]